tara:strand:- start:425268 stop:425489 length:222 start_codon:yes stop_codon:yes gene_type:complete
MDINDMRKKIEEMNFDDPMVRHVFDAARHLGLSGEDKYVALAYQAIEKYKRLEKHVLQYHVSATFMINPDSNK